MAAAVVGTWVASLVLLKYDSHLSINSSHVGGALMVASISGMLASVRR